MNYTKSKFYTLAFDIAMAHNTIDTKAKGAAIKDRSPE